MPNLSTRPNWFDVSRRRRSRPCQCFKQAMASRVQIEPLMAKGRRNGYNQIKQPLNRRVYRGGSKGPFRSTYGIPIDKQAVTAFDAAHTYTGGVCPRSAWGTRTGARRACWTTSPSATDSFYGSTSKSVKALQVGTERSNAQ